MVKRKLLITGNFICFIVERDSKKCYVDNMNEYPSQNTLLENHRGDGQGLSDNQPTCHRGRFIMALARRTVAMTLSLLAIFWIGGFFFFIHSIPLDAEDKVSKTDAIVVWTGWNCRVSTGIDLLAQGISDKLFISGIRGGYPHLTFDKCKLHASNSSFEAATLQQEMVRLRPKITLGVSALSTIGNAMETAKWAEASGVKSVRLVTTGIHLPRSLMEFQRYMPDIRVIPHPVPLEHFDHRDWYNSLDVFKICAREYTKYALFLLGIRPEWRDHIHPEG